MSALIPPVPYPSGNGDVRRCLSCGTTENMKRRRYCSIECRQKLRNNLNMRTGLLQTLQIRYATFYFTDALIMLDMLPYDSRDLLSFIYPRRRGKKPVDDFCRMFNDLGNAWWEEVRRTKKRYLATRLVLSKARPIPGDIHCVRPLEVREPARMARSLTFLKLRSRDLHSPNLQQIIKRAFRRRAKEVHPDQGGDSALFRKLRDAYEDLIRWAERPVFTTRRGFPDKWFYEGALNRWTQPTPLRRLQPPFADEDERL
ncbi:MAG: J domain-containing protein [Desulfobacterales bacterium]